jgi:hypothetical protein
MPSFRSPPTPGTAGATPSAPGRPRWSTCGSTTGPFSAGKADAGRAGAGAVCEIPGVGPIPAATARALAEDAILAALITEATDVRAVSHVGRVMPARLRTAVVARDETCVVPGCDVRHGLQIDHVVPIAERGPTRLDNLARLCSWHHYLKTHHRWRLSGGPGSWEWRGQEHASPARDRPRPRSRRRGRSEASAASPARGP